MHARRQLPLPPILPALRHGETLYSWAGMVHRWCGSSNALATSTALYGAPYTALLHDFPARIHELSARTGGLLGAPEDLALNRTLLGFFLACQNRESAGLLLRRVLEDSVPDLKFRLGIPASRLGAAHPLKGCADCMSEDEATYGTAHWHIDHQIPSVWVCPRHGTVLWYADTRSTPVHLRDWILPRLGSEPRWVRPQLEGSSARNKLSKIAQFAIALSTESPGALEGATLAASYRTRMAALGMATENGQLRLTDLAKAVTSFVEGLENLPGFGNQRLNDQAAIICAPTISRRRPRPAHPHKHVCLMALLFDDWEDFKILYEHSQYRAANSELDLAHSLPRLRNLETNRKVFLSIMCACPQSVRGAAKAAGVSTATGLQWAAAAGHRIARRPKKIDAVFLQRLRELLPTGKEKQVLANEVGISPVTLSRLLATHPDLELLWADGRATALLRHNREHFRALLESNPKLPVRTIRKSAKSGYAWLYRNDRPWLSRLLHQRHTIGPKDER